MNFLSRLVQSGPLKSILKPLLTGISPKKQQEQIDLYRAAVLLKGHHWHEVAHQQEASGHHVSKSLSQDDVDRFYREVDSWTTKEIKANVHKSIEKQIISMLRHVDTYSSTIEKAIAGAGSSSLASRGGDVGSTAKSAMFNAVGFELDLRTSTIADAGEGVFVRGSITPGTVVTFHPGHVHLAEFASQQSYMKDLLPDDNFMMIVRNDGHIIDARGTNQAPFNPFAFGHKINHVPAGKTPNCLQIAFDYPEDPLGIEAFPQELRRYIPNAYKRPPTIFGTSDRSACMRGIVYIAAKPLSENDELFVDYRLNPFAGALPSWYAPFDSEGANRRWIDEDSGEGSSTDSGSSSGSNSGSDSGHGDDTNKSPDQDDLLFRKRTPSK